ncbi:MAG TPA: hypothetical protein DDX89_08810 [Candidatus Omnitrophica bacterium]|nr:MAG: hypothetical protein A2Z92_04810 [Omnitrophica WOR_2 bacterium GWA2_63_20]OGX17215.1 MAG: hypothetical protein A2105_04405 [Omnitrophica WOR_2 bacterium GWF2_63_9]HAM42136.1 hypothetical protein [Candidatus Omnitrophota bacterium]HBH97858.1 hypothetical protein [Candidatus Omnitrophota bacterium]
MRAKPEAQQAAQELRKQGLSYREIMQQIPVSKGSVSLWCRDVALTEAQAEHLRQRKIEAGRWGRQLLMQLRSSGVLPRRRQFRVSNGQEVSQIRVLYEGERLSVREVAARLGLSFWRVYHIMQEHGISRRRGSEQNYATYKTKPQFLVKSPLTPAEEQLRVAGTMLYWAEGRKTGCLVEFSNSEPRLIALFLTFLRRVCGIAESRLRIHVYAYVDQDINQLKNFWSQITGVPLEQFTKPFVRQLTPNVSRRKMRWGLVNVRYSDTRLLRLILQWGEEFAQSWAGA